MKNLKLVFALLVSLGTTGLASADGYFSAVPGPQVSASVAFPGFRLVVGRPGYYGWYQGRYYSRAAWDRFCQLHRDRDRYAYNSYRSYDRDRDNGRRFNDDRDQDSNRHFSGDRGHYGNEDRD